jgi:hypothetical protein
MKDTYLSVREKGFEDIQTAIRIIERKSNPVQIITIITPLERKLVEEMKKNSDDPIFWF